ncbi:hypothetical protein AB0C65_35015 [Nocardia sp. NPDC048505]|uniref:hypothetical protein n=1 Tax=Nocardia sp. NPDC048505 TaxID=3155756 RepID=UPI0033C1D4F1
MTLNRKGSRLITIDGTDYRWTVRPKPTYDQALGGPMRFAVELADRPGPVLVVTTDRPRPDNWMNLPTEPIRAGEVEAGVRKALAAGFDFTAQPDRRARGARRAS